MAKQKPLWVKPESHHLCKMLAARTKKTMRGVVHESLLLYQRQIEQKEQIEESASELIKRAVEERLKKLEKRGQNE